MELHPDVAYRKLISNPYFQGNVGNDLWFTVFCSFGTHVAQCWSCFFA